jgi:hypothetical protein
MPSILGPSGDTRGEELRVSKGELHVEIAKTAKFVSRRDAELAKESWKKMTTGAD